VPTPIIESAAQVLRARRRAILRSGIDLTGSGAPEPALTPRAQTQLKETNDALSRIETGSFGTCIGCGRAIERPRLERAPWIRRCATCTCRSSS